MADVWNFLRDPQARSEMRNALTDSANRGMVAGSLGAPVDLATTLTNLLIAGGGYVGHKTGPTSAASPTSMVANNLSTNTQSGFSIAVGEGTAANNTAY